MLEKSSKGDFGASIRVAYLLASRDVRRSNIWITIFIVAVMALAFLNLITIVGVLLGIPRGAEHVIRDYYTGDLIISTPPGDSYIENGRDLLNFVKNFPGVEAVSGRYVEAGQIEVGHKTKFRSNEISEKINVLVVGIDPEDENIVTNIKSVILSGRSLEGDDFDKVIVGINLLSKYAAIDSPSEETIDNVDVGSNIRLIVGGSVREVEVVGVVKSRAQETDRRVFINDTQLRQLIGRQDLNIDEIVIRAKAGISPEKIKNELLEYDISWDARIQTYTEARPKFLDDVDITFKLLGNIIGLIGLVVASITVFIVIFINAIIHARQIGILKGIGITGFAINASYVLQSLFYAILGTGIGIFIFYVFLDPYFLANPIIFPFSDATIVSTTQGVLSRAIILLFSAIVAGFVPAFLIVRRSTIDAITGR